MLDHFNMFATYNRWANRRIYDAASVLGDEAYRQDRGAFFGSLHRTLNHLLCADRVWMQRFTGAGTAPTSLDAVLFDDLAGLTAAREAEDQRILDWIAGLDAAALSAPFTYTPITTPTPVTQRLGPALAHFFNHQTHHRGQCHAMLTGLGQPSVVLDMVAFQRLEGQRWA